MQVDTCVGQVLSTTRPVRLPRLAVQGEQAFAVVAYFLSTYTRSRTSLTFGCDQVVVSASETNQLDVVSPAEVKYSNSHEAASTGFRCVHKWRLACFYPTQVNFRSSAWVTKLMEILKCICFAVTGLLPYMAPGKHVSTHTIGQPSSVCDTFLRQKQLPALTSIKPNRYAPVSGHRQRRGMDVAESWLAASDRKGTPFCDTSMSILQVRKRCALLYM